MKKFSSQYELDDYIRTIAKNSAEDIIDIFEVILKDFYSDSFDLGYEEGYDEGFELGKKEGYDEGYEAGYEEGIDT